MNIQARKLSIIQKLLMLQNEDAIIRLEQYLKMEKDIEKQPMTMTELNDRIGRSELDFENNKFKSSTHLKQKYQ